MLHLIRSPSFFQRPCKPMALCALCTARDSLFDTIMSQLIGSSPACMRVLCFHHAPSCCSLLQVFAVILLLAIPSHAQSNELAAVANDADLSFGHPKHEICVDFLRGLGRWDTTAIFIRQVFGTTKPCCSCRAGDPERQILSTPTMLRRLQVGAHQLAKLEAIGSWLCGLSGLSALSG